MSIYYINVAVATLWTKNTSSRPIDHPILTNPVSIRHWLATLSDEMKLQLCNDNLVQSQALYGQEVEVIEVRDRWANVLILDQPSSKNEKGYPGWIPVAQLHKKEEGFSPLASSNATVIKQTAFLYKDYGEKWMELSYQTKLPIMDNQQHGFVKVKTPTGYGFLRSEDITENDSLTNHPDTGQAILKEAEKFIGLPYLWGGVSGFGYDCSGFSYTMCKAFGITIPRDAHEQAKVGEQIEINRILPGDLLFFAHEKGKGHIHHVAIYYGNNQMIHSPKTGKPIEVTEIKGLYKEELCAARRYWK